MILSWCPITRAPYWPQRARSLAPQSIMIRRPNVSHPADSRRVLPSRCLFGRPAFALSLRSGEIATLRLAER